MSDIKEHYFIVKWSKQNGWSIDTDTEEARFPDGTVWNGTEWEYPYLGNGNYNDDNDLIATDLEEVLSETNLVRGIVNA